MEPRTETEAIELLAAIRPWIQPDQAFIVDMAKQNMAARLTIAVTLLESEQQQSARKLLQSIIDTPETEDIEHEQARLRALVELAHLEMERLAYDVAEDYLWQARNRYTPQLGEGFSREDISLLIAQCRFGQGFVQDAIDRAEEILRKLDAVHAPAVKIAKTHQQLAWFYLHKADLPQAFQHIRKAMELAPSLEQSLVAAGKEAERQGQYEKAMEHYFDAIILQ